MRAALRVAMEPAARGKRKHTARPRMGKGTVLTPVEFYDGPRDLRRIQIARVVEERGDYMGETLFLELRIFLSGVVVRTTYTNARHIDFLETAMSFPETLSMARTGKITDWGRFEAACIALAGLVDVAGEDASQEQQEEIYRSYQGLLAWREELRRKVEASDAALDVAAAKVRSVF